MDTKLGKALEDAGGPKKIAALLSSKGHSITPQAISQWKSNRVPAKWALTVSELTGIPLSTLVGRIGAP